MSNSLTISRRRFLQLTGIVAGGAALGASGVGVHETHELVVEHVTIYLRRLPAAFDGFRIVQISDIHFDEFTNASHVQHAVEAANAESPDLAILTGDFVTAPNFSHRESLAEAEKAWPCAQILSGLRTRFGRFSVLGNHDLATKRAIVTEALNTHGHTVLRNSALPIEVGAARLWLAGLDDALDGHPDIPSALQRVPPNECTIMMVHEPDIADRVASFPVDFQISGHSHGGQVRFPLVGPLYLPRLARKYVMGHYQVGNLQLYTNRGLGVILLPFRLECPPELTVFTLRSAPGT